MNAIKALVTPHQNPYGLMFAMGKVAVWNPDRTQFHTQQTPLELRAHVVVDANKESTRVPGMNSVGSAHSFQIFPKPMATQTGAPRGLQMAHVFLLNHPILHDESPLSIPPPPGKSQLESWNLKRPAVNVGRLLLQWIIIRSTFFVINTSSCLFCCKLICISFKNMILSENNRLWTIHVYSCICATESWVYRPILRLGCLNAGLVWKNGTKIHWLAPTFPVETVVTWRYAPFWDTPKSWSDTVYMHVYIQKIYNMLIMLCIYIYIYKDCTWPFFWA